MSPANVGSIRATALAVLAICIVPLGTAQARPLYWPQYGYWWGDHAPLRHSHRHKHAEPTLEKKDQTQDAPSGPLQIIISIADQRISVYDNDALIARSSVSTGIPGHPTPLGVFSIISKQRWHRSGGAHLYDLWCRRCAGHDGKPVPPGARHSWHWLQDRRRYRHEAWRRENRHDPGARRHLVCTDRSYGRWALWASHHRSVPLAEELLEVGAGLIRTALDLELADGTVVADSLDETDCIFLASLYRAEQAIAERLLALSRAKLPWDSIDADKALPWIEHRISLELAPSQKAAVRLALASKVLVITGGPGVGKTTIVNAILRILAAKTVKILLCAPTGRAAKRLNETTGQEAKTIHRLLEVDPKGGGFKRNVENPLDCDLLVLDETSMVDVLLMHALLKAVPETAALLVVGDVDQLPSVGPGQILADMITSGAVPVVRLTEVFRQAAQSRIITSAHRINQGSIPDLGKPKGDSDFYFVQANDPETAVPRIIELVKTRIPQRFGLDPIRDIQVLCPMNRGGVGARSLNIELQAALNPAGERKVERFGWTFAPGDKVMQIENDYDKEVYNGDIGYIDDVDPDAGELTASFDGRAVTYGFGELDTLVPAYAATIHKSQGSEYPAVVIPVLTQHYAMLQRNLLYTGVTRGKQLVVLVGKKKAVAIAGRNVSGRRRWSKLNGWLAAPAGRQNTAS